MPPRVTCTHCKRQTSCDIKQCIHCGQALPEELLARVVPPRRSLPVTCPLCTSPCDFVTLWGIQVDLCSGCRGIWFDESEVADLATRLTNQTLADESEAVLAKLDEPPTTDRRAAFLRCPICGKQLLRRHYDRNADLSTHRCQGCGTFIERKPMLDLLWFLATHRRMDAGDLAMDNQPVANTYRPPPADAEVEHYNRMHLHTERLLDFSTPPAPYDPCFGDPIRPPIRSGTDLAAAAVSLLTDLMLK